MPDHAKRAAIGRAACLRQCSRFVRTLGSAQICVVSNVKVRKCVTHFALTKTQFQTQHTALIISNALATIRED